MDVNCFKKGKKKKKKDSTGKPLGRQGIKGIRESKAQVIAGQYLNLAFEHLSFVHMPPQTG